MLSLCIFAFCVLGGLISFRYGLNRVVAFYWFFLTGYLFEKKIRANTERLPMFLCGLVLAVLFSAIIFCSGRINAEVLFSNLEYAKGGYTWVERVMYFCVATLIVTLLGRIFQNSRPLLGWLGRNTMPVFVLHTVPYVILEAAGMHEAVKNLCSPGIAILYAGGLTAAVIFFCTRKPLIAVLNFVWDIPMKLIDKKVARRNK